MSLRSLSRSPRRRTHRTSGPRLAGLVAVLGVLAAAAAAVARRRASGTGGPSSAREGEGAGAAPSQEPVAEVVEDTYTCECGQEYRVSGQDRHRVYWRKDSELSDPVLGQQCVNCERPLPHDHAAA
jgi:hypothetical protein